MCLLIIFYNLTKHNIIKNYINSTIILSLFYDTKM